MKYSKSEHLGKTGAGAEDGIRFLELLHRINARVWKRIAPTFKEGRLSVTEAIALMAVHKRGKIRVTKLAARIGIPASTLTGILDRLVGQGLLERSRDPGDRRSVIMKETPKGGEFIRNLMSPMHRALHGTLASMTASRRKRLIQDLQYVLDSLETADGKYDSK
jgi:DNA-binding MarR family transcriptional regulator